MHSARLIRPTLSSVASLPLQYWSAIKSLARPGRKQVTATKLTFASHSRTIQKDVRLTSSPRQQWPLRRTKYDDLSIVSSVGSG